MNIRTFIAVFICSPLFSLASPFEDGRTVLFLGDSITQAGGYVANIEAYLWTTYPEREVEILNLGQSGETVSGDNERRENPKPRPYLHDRIDRILEEITPDTTFICYGMNDGIYHPPMRERREHFIGGMLRLVSKLRATGTKIIFLTPPPFDAASKDPEILRPLGAEQFEYKMPYEGYDEVLADYGSWLLEQQGELADGAIDVGGKVRSFLVERRKVEPDYEHGDGVHPDAAGHLAMALAVLEGCGEDRAKAEALLTQLTGVQLLPDSGEKTPLYDLLKKRNNKLNTVYRKHCLKGNPSASDHEVLAAALATAGEEEQAIREQIVAQSEAEVATP